MKNLLIIFLLPLVFTLNAQHDWSFTAEDYEYSQAVVGMAYIQGNIVNGPDLQVGAFCGDECRGYVKPTGGSCTYSTYYLTVYGSLEQGEVIDFVLKDTEGNEYDFVNTIIFENEAVVGDIELPFLWMDELLYSSTDFFYFALESGEEAIVDTISKTISLIVTAETATQNISPYFVTAPGAKVYLGDDLQISQQSVINLDAPLVYTVHGVDGLVSEWTLNAEIVASIETDLESSIDFSSISSSGFFYLNSNRFIDVEVYDLSGRLIKKIERFSGNEIYIETSGTYILKLTDLSGKEIVMKIHRL
jgi:hypothetical protein